MTSKRVKWDLRFAYYNLWTVKMVFAHTNFGPWEKEPRQTLNGTLGSERNFAHENGICICPTTSGASLYKSRTVAGL